MPEFKLPDDITEVKEINPTDLVILSVPKTGKTNILAELTKKQNAILFSLERGGVDYVSGKFISIYPNDDTSFAEACENYKTWRDLLLKNKGKYKYLLVDGLSALDEMSELMGTYYYMYSVPQGKNFNLNVKTGKYYEYGDDNFKLVTTLGEGYGYRYTREWFMQQMNFFSEIAPYRIYSAHVKDKLIKNSQDEQVTGLEINLTGKLKNIVSAKVSSLSKLVADGDKRYLSFEVDNENIIAGSRVPHLSGQILISEKLKDDTIKTYWENIYK